PSKNPASATVTAVANTTTTVATSQGATCAGQSVTFTATVTATPVTAGAPTGAVTFKDGTATLGIGNLSGSGPATSTATFNTSALSVGGSPHSITAVYG